MSIMAESAKTDSADAPVRGGVHGMGNANVMSAMMNSEYSAFGRANSGV